MDAPCGAEHDRIARGEALGTRNRVESRATVRDRIRAQSVQRFLGRDEAERGIRYCVAWIELDRSAQQWNRRRIDDGV